MGVGPSRREFLATIAATSVAVACSTDDARRSERLRPATPTSADLPAGIFALGVASGDPLTDRVILWTRLASDPVAVDGGAPDGDVEVAYDVATDETFETLVASGVVTATADRAHAVHVDVTGLKPGTAYVYRFRAGDQTSPVGRTRTVPGPDAAPESFRFVFASCQDYQWGHYAAWTHAAEEDDLDLVVFLGDYIYETNLGDLSPDKSGARVWANQAALTLADYRQRYAQTKSDLRLQAAHHAAPWLTLFDDHEVSNNFAGDVGQADGDAPNSRDRRLAAFQAWYEHTPVRITPEPTSYDALDVHRAIRWGRLATVFGIETRQHADPPACRAPVAAGTPSITLSDDGPDCDDRSDPARTNLGEAQEAWLGEGLATSSTTWNVIANPVMMAGLNIGTAAEPKYTLDMWDGYPAARDRLLARIVESKVSNPVVVTGDWHASFVLDVKQQPGGPTVMPEFLGTSISTVLFAQDYRPENPHVRYFVAEYGYAVATITPDDFTCDFKYIADVWDPNSAITRTDTWRLRAGEHEPEQV